jgi:deoxyribodipyrimidine photo-lyase
LRFGTLSIRDLVNKCFEVNSISSNKWLNELVWRDFYSSILFNFPHVEKLEFNKKYQNLKWNKSETFFNAWSNAETGYPIVDAAIKELNLTGFMHNRCRMIVASFLTKHLLCDWRLGEAYFAMKLIDFDLASNNGGWQWAASTGCDSQPYFRVFNPSLQSEKFDKLGMYIKKYLPIFKSVEPKYLHSPWQYSEELKKYGIKLGEDYPLPIVNHPKARVKAIDFFKKV